MGGSLPYKWGSAAQRRAILLYKNTFFPFLESDRERTGKKNVHLKHLITPLPERTSGRRISRSFLVFTEQGTESWNTGSELAFGSRLAPAGARDAGDGPACPTKRTISRKQKQLKPAVDASMCLAGFGGLQPRPFCGDYEVFAEVSSPRNVTFL